MKFFLSLILLLFSTTIFSQKLTGKVTYIVSMESYLKGKIISIKNLFISNF